MAIVNERHQSTKPVQVDPKTGKPMPASATPVRTASPTFDANGDANGGFFGSFFASKNKKKMAAMEAPPPTLKASGTLSEREGIEVEIISEWRVLADWGRFLTRLELLINSYYNIVKKTMIDMVPKAIMLNLVQLVPLPSLPRFKLTTQRFTKDEMQRELLENMYRTDTLDDLLKESDYTVRRRKECQQMVESLSRASEIVSQVQ
jgi:hypothetical protein